MGLFRSRKAMGEDAKYGQACPYCRQATYWWLLDRHLKEAHEQQYAAAKERARTAFSRRRGE